MLPEIDPLARDPSSGVEVHRPDNRFIPLRPWDLVEALAQRTTGSPAAAPRTSEAEEFLKFAAKVRCALEQEAMALENAISDLYSPFNPDRDTLPLGTDEFRRAPEGYAALFEHLSRLLDKANFEPLNPVAIDRALRVAKSHGLRVRLNPERVEQVSICVRGRGTILRRRLTWRHPIRGVSDVIPVYRRLAVVARLKDDPHVIIKLFKDIPEEDVEALLPHAEVEVTWFDRVKMFGGGVGAVGSTAGKIIGLVTTVGFFISQVLWLLIFGLGILAYRTFMGYRRARRDRDWQRTRHLYFQNLSNNLAAIHSLIAMNTQEELKEAALAYAICRWPSSPIGCAEDVQRQAEVWLKERFGIELHFDVEDAVCTLERLGLWEDRDCLRVIDCREARQSEGRAQHSER